jgi:hypothetical protein
MVEMQTAASVAGSRVRQENEEQAWLPFGRQLSTSDNQIEQPKGWDAPAAVRLRAARGVRDGLSKRPFQSRLPFSKVAPIPPL